MQTSINSKLERSRPVVAAALVAGLYWVWWDSFHEVGRFFMQVPTPFDFVFTRYSTLSCQAKPVGIVVGCLAMCLLLRYGKRLMERKGLPTMLLVVELALHILYYLSMLAEQYAAACLVYLVVSACTVPTMLLIALQLRPFGKREIVMVAIGGIACYGALNNLVFPLFLRTAPLPAIGAAYLVALVAAYGLSRRLVNLSPNQATMRAGVDAKTPPPLVVHLTVYGLAFGILHVLGGAIAKGPYSINIAVLFACAITLFCLAFLFLRASSNHEIWSKIRSTVFPLSVIGYLLIPFLASDAALALTEAGNLLYNAIFFIGCFTLMRKTDVDPRVIVVKGLLYKNLGTFAGVLWARMYYDTVSVEGIAHSALSIVIVSLLTVATFWVGSDEQIRKIWGLRKNLSPKKYNDLVLQLKCGKLSEERGLTARESEILLHLGQGTRAPEIRDKLGVSIGTVRSHIKHLYMKLDVHSLSELNKLLKNVEVDDPETA